MGEFRGDQSVCNLKIQNFLVDKTSIPPNYKLFFVSICSMSLFKIQHYKESVEPIFAFSPYPAAVFIHDTLSDG